MAFKAFDELTDGLPEPVRRAWERSLTSGRAAVGRRTLLRAAALTAGAGTLAACGNPRRAPGDRGLDRQRRQGPLGQREGGRLLQLAAALDADEKDKQKHGILDAFTAATGIRVKYNEDVNDNVEFFGKVTPQPAAGQDAGRDLWCSPTGWPPG
ncbi:hypothetical protein [Kitasatospora sp. NPDC001683]